MLTAKDKENLRKAKRRLEATYTSIRDRRAVPETPAAPQERQGIDWMIYNRLTRATALTIEIDILLKAQEQGKKEIVSSDKPSI